MLQSLLQTFIKSNNFLVWCPLLSLLPHLAYHSTLRDALCLFLHAPSTPRPLPLRSPLPSPRIHARNTTTPMPGPLAARVAVLLFQRLIVFRPPLGKPSQGVAAVDDSVDTPPEVTIEPADNGYVVRHYQRGAGKGPNASSGRTVRRVAATTEDALGHARLALSGTAKARSPKRKPLRDGQLGASPASEGDGGSGLGMTSSPAAQTPPRSATRRRRPRAGGRR